MERDDNLLSRPGARPRPRQGTDPAAVPSRDLRLLFPLPEERALLELRRLTQTLDQLLLRGAEDFVELRGKQAADARDAFVDRRDVHVSALLRNLRPPQQRRRIGDVE